MGTRIGIVFGIVIAGLVGLRLATGDLGIKGIIFQQAFPTDYFEPYNAFPPTLEPVNSRVYSFRVGFNRGLVVNTDEGLAVFDTFNKTFAQALKVAITEKFPGKPVRWVFYSHHHLDHVRGAEALEPMEIIGHEDVNASLDDWPHAAQIARVNVPVEGDVDMMLGSVRARLLYMPRSHSTTLYGFHFPDESVVYAPDMMFVKAMPPFGFPDWYYPGYIRALDRLIELNAAHYVPSHFDNGNRADLIDYRTMMVDFRDAVTASLAKYDYDAASGTNLRAVFAEVYPELRDRYGHWHGFEAMFVPHFGGQAGGTYLGF